MLTNLPSTPEAILKMEWDDYEPHFKSLQSTQLTSRKRKRLAIGLVCTCRQTG